MIQIAAVILAGGQGARMGGVRKSALRLRNRTLLDWVSLSLAGQADPLIVATGPQPQSSGLEVTAADLLPEWSGPLAGLAAGIHHLQANRLAPDYLLSVSVDTPFFPTDFVEKTLQVIGERQAVIAAFGGQHYPTNGLWRMAALQGLPTRHVSGTGPASPKALARELDALVLDWQQLTEANPFANLNTLSDLIAVERRAHELH